jgi:adenine-specific DNA-methyltransferase
VNPITAQDPLARSLDVVTDNIQRLQQLFPDVFTDGKVDLDVLRDLLGESVDEREEKYGLNWHGKRRARQIALSPSVGTLRPVPADSVDWDTTQNIMIEGDNLEVLKLLQKSYAGQVKLIYIDPPYNTGRDFVYPDYFQDTIRNYQELTGQVEGGRKTSSNNEASGRFHTEWLNMMYPRLKLARTLLQEDGVIFISIDDHEVSSVRKMCDELFGEENLIAQMVWEGASKNDAQHIGVNHEYVVIYAKSKSSQSGAWKVSKEDYDLVLKEAERLKKEFHNDYDTASEALAQWYRHNKSKPVFSHYRFRFIDSNGVYKEDDPTAPGGRKFKLINPKNGREIPLRQGRGWAFDQEVFDQMVADGKISFVTENSIMVRRYLHETTTSTPQSVIYQPARSASERLHRLMGKPVFSFPKDETVLRQLVEMSTHKDSLILDFFAGSGTTGHAVMAQNAIDGGSRRYILVQLPEPLNLTNKDQSIAADFCSQLNKPLNIAELTKERLRRAAKKIHDDNSIFSGDLGFRVYRLDSTNILPWDPNPQDISGSLFAAQEHLKDGRTEQDILTELLLKLGLPLTVPIEERAFGSHTLYAVGAGTLMACLASRIEKEEVEALAQGMVAWQQELAPVGDSQVVLRDSAFRTDVAKANFTAILEQAGFDKRNIRSL